MTGLRFGAVVLALAVAAGAAFGLSGEPAARAARRAAGPADAVAAEAPAPPPDPAAAPEPRPIEVKPFAGEREAADAASEEKSPPGSGARVSGRVLDERR